MALDALSLPVDIPWKHLDSSRDMFAPAGWFPPIWRTSLAIFYYEPEIDKMEYPDHRITYFKVTCSVSGLALGSLFGTEIQVDKDVWGAVGAANVESAIRAAVSSYLPCVGAFLQVSFHPSLEAEKLDGVQSVRDGVQSYWRDGVWQPADIDISNLPLIIDFEPKKREVYEAVTATGEAMSRSSSGLQVTKGGTTTLSAESTEKSGSTLSGNLGVSGVGISAASSSESTTKRGWTTENVEVRTIDDAREKRESTSHTTQLTQMYHRLDSYHLGTNRALFALFPRPHVLPTPILERDQDGIGWMRKLEGIQEFFFAVQWPKELNGLCVESQLQTLHVVEWEQTVTGAANPEKGSEKHRVSEQFELIYSNADYRRIEIKLEKGRIVDTDAGSKGGYDEYDVVIEPLGTGIITHDVKVEGDRITIDLLANRKNDSIFNSHPKFSATYVIWYVSEMPETERHVHAAATGRSLRACLKSEEERLHQEMVEGLLESLNEWGSVFFEKKLPDLYWKHVARSATEPIERTNELNRLQASFKDMMIGEVSNPRPYRFDPVSLFESDTFLGLVLGKLSKDGLLDQVVNKEKRIRIPESLFHHFDNDQRDSLEQLDLGELIDSPTATLANRYGVSRKTMSALKLSHLGLSVVRRTPAGSSETTGSSATFPNLLDLSIDQARSAVRGVRMYLGEVTYRDSDKPKDTVIEQSLETGSPLIPGREVNLVLATGAIVCVPDVVGKPLGEAMAMLRDAGLEAEPRVDFEGGKGTAGQSVSSVTPMPGSFTTPGAPVVLRVRSGG